MDLPAGPSKVDRFRSPRKIMKTNILLYPELFNLLESDEWILFDKEFNDDHDEISNDSNDNYEHNDLINEGDDLQNVVITDFVGAEVTESEWKDNRTNFNWFTDPPNIEYLEFTVMPWLKCLPNGDKPIDYFNWLVTDELLDLLVEENNIYATDIFLDTVSDKAKICEWIRY